MLSRFKTRVKEEEEQLIESCSLVKILLALALAHFTFWSTLALTLVKCLLLCALALVLCSPNPCHPMYSFTFDTELLADRPTNLQSDTVH